MKKRYVVSIVLFLLVFPIIGFSSTYTFTDDFNDGNLNGWTSIGANHWENSGDSLQSSSWDYSTIVLDGSNQASEYQSITVDAYFDIHDASNSNRIAQLRLRTESSWGNGYLADFQEGGLYLYAGGGEIARFSYASSPIIDDSWNRLRFDVLGTGSNTNLKLWVGDSVYLDFDYNNTNLINDTGFSGLGRLIEYDNVTAISSDNAPVPEPATMLLFGIGLLGLAGVSRRKE